MDRPPLNQPELLADAYYRATLKRAAPDLDLVSWARAELAELRAARQRRGQVDTLGQLNAGFMEGWAPADIINDLSDQIDTLEAALAAVKDEHHE